MDIAARKASRIKLLVALGLAGCAGSARSGQEPALTPLVEARATDVAALTRTSPMPFAFADETFASSAAAPEIVPERVAASDRDALYRDSFDAVFEPYGHAPASSGPRLPQAVLEAPGTRAAFASIGCTLGDDELRGACLFAPETGFQFLVALSVTPTSTVFGIGGTADTPARVCALDVGRDAFRFCAHLPDVHAEVEAFGESDTLVFVYVPERLSLHAIARTTGALAFTREGVGRDAHLRGSRILLESASRLIGLDSSTGREAWSLTARLLALEDTRALVANEEGLAEIELATGSANFALGTDDVVRGAWSLPDRFIVQGSERVTVLRARDGALLAQADTDGFEQAAWRAPWLYLRDQRDRERLGNRGVLAINVETGRRMRFPNEDRGARSFVVGEATLTLVDDFGCVDAYDRERGDHLWWSCVEDAPMRVIPAASRTEDVLFTTRPGEEQRIDPARRIAEPAPPVVITGRIVGPWTAGDPVYVGRERVIVDASKRFRVTVHTRGDVHVRIGETREIIDYGSGCETFAPLTESVRGRARIGITIRTSVDTWCQQGFNGA